MSAALPSNAEQATVELATPTARLQGSSLEHVPHVLLVLRGDQRTFQHRQQLRAWGLRWVREERSWLGILPKTRAWYLTGPLGLTSVGAPVEVEPAPREKEHSVPPGSTPPAGPAGPHFPVPRHEPSSSPVPLNSPTGAQLFRPSPLHRAPYARSSLESRVAFPRVDNEGREDRRYSLLEITSGLADDSREADERAAAANLRDLRGRVKAARAALAGVPGSEETLARDWILEAHFYARWGITQEQFRHGVPDSAEPEEECVSSYVDVIAEAREAAVLPGSDSWA